MPILALYEHFSRTIARDHVHTTLCRLIKIEALTKLSMFKEAIRLLEMVQLGDNLPYYLEEKCKTASPPQSEYVTFFLSTKKRKTNKLTFKINFLHSF